MKGRKYFIIIFLIVIFILILDFSGWPYVSGKIFIPLQSLFSSVDQKTGDSKDLLLNKKNLKEENKKLSQDITNLIAENIKLRNLEVENEKLRKELDFIKRENYKTVFANIIGRREDEGLTWFIIDRGSKDMISEGLVVVSGGLVVGRIEKVMTDYSYLLPITDERVRIAMAIIPASSQENKRKVEGIIKGKNGLIAEIDLIPLDKEIKDGDLVLTSGTEYKVPNGLFIGTLKGVEKKSSNLFYQGIVELPIKLENLEMVGVIIPRI